MIRNKDIDIITLKDGSLLLDTIFKGQYYKKVYCFYSIKEALEEFKKYIREEFNKMLINQD